MAILQSVLFINDQFYKNLRKKYIAKNAITASFVLLNKTLIFKKVCWKLALINYQNATHQIITLLLATWIKIKKNLNKQNKKSKISVLYRYIVIKWNLLC